MKIMRLSNGLGNAMFQYATYLQLKRMYPEEDIYLDTIWYDFIEYPVELNQIFYLNISELDFHKALSKKYSIDFEQQLEPLRYWKKVGAENYSSYVSELENIKNNNRISGMLNFKELAELYLPYVKDLRIYSDMPLNLNEYVAHDMTMRPEDGLNWKGRMVKILLEKSDSTLLFLASSLTSGYCRKKLFLDLCSRRRPDFSSVAATQLKQEGNVYYNIYGHPDYCKGIRDELLKAFTFPSFDSEQNLRIAEEIDHANSVAIHARVVSFDYGMKNAVKRGYFQKAVRYIKKRVPDCSFFVFSDNPDWCKENLSVLGLSNNDKTAFVDWNKGKNNFRDMQLISLCKHQIIPNSTFSWWGGYLCQNPDKIFVTPYATLPGTVSF